VHARSKIKGLPSVNKINQMGTNLNLDVKSRRVHTQDELSNDQTKDSDSEDEWKGIEFFESNHYWRFEQ